MGSAVISRSLPAVGSQAGFNGWSSQEVFRVRDHHQRLCGIRGVSLDERVIAMGQVGIKRSSAEAGVRRSDGINRTLFEVRVHQAEVRAFLTFTLHYIMYML